MEGCVCGGRQSEASEHKTIGFREEKYEKKQWVCIQYKILQMEFLKSKNMLFRILHFSIIIWMLYFWASATL